MLLPGQKLGQLTVVRSIDDGTMTWAFEVTHDDHPGRFTLKLLAIDDDEAEERFLQEGRTMVRFNHPNLVHGLGVVQTPEGPGIVQQHVDGPALGDWLSAEPRTFGDRLSVFRGICRRHDQAHSRGVVHRNLSPWNVLVARGLDGWQPVVIDFTLAKYLADAVDFTTGVGALMGTLGYMAPEQHEAANTVDVRADVYSLGCLLYLMTTGVEPYQEESDMDLLWTLLHSQPPPPKQHAPELSDALATTIENAMARSPDDRTPTVQALLDELGE